jgi:hypothetical protein
MYQFKMSGNGRAEEPRLSEHLCQDTSLLRTSNFSPKLVIEFEFYCCSSEGKEMGAIAPAPENARILIAK